MISFTFSAETMTFLAATQISERLIHVKKNKASEACLVRKANYTNSLC